MTHRTQLESVSLPSPHFAAVASFTSCMLAGIHMAKPRVRLDKPSYLGFSILHLVKLKTYAFYNKYIAKKFGNGEPGYNIQYNTILRTSIIVSVSSAWPSSKALQAKRHKTENICPEESHNRQKEIGKSTN